jgi:hypothetical protein
VNVKHYTIRRVGQIEAVASEVQYDWIAVGRLVLVRHKVLLRCWIAAISTGASITCLSRALVEIFSCSAISATIAISSATNLVYRIIEKLVIAIRPETIGSDGCFRVHVHFGIATEGIEWIAYAGSCNRRRVRKICLVGIGRIVLRASRRVGAFDRKVIRY